MQGLNLNTSKSMLKVGSVIVISCTVIGGPISLNITWFKEGEKIVLSHRRKITTVEHQSCLTIRNAMAQDEGEYHCQARYTFFSLLKLLLFRYGAVVCVLFSAV